MKRTQKEIDAQIKGLQEILNKPTFRRTTMFGDSNDAAVRAQITVLRNKLTQDDLDEKVDEGEFTEHQDSSAREALDWLTGATDDTPVAGWNGLH